MEGEIPIEEQVFTPNPLLIADLIFESPKPAPAKPRAYRERDDPGFAMNYARHPSASDVGDQQPHVHFEDGKTTRMTPHQPSFSGPVAPPYAQQPQAAYPLQQNQQAYPQQAPYYPPPPNQQPTSAPIPIPTRTGRDRSISHPPPLLNGPYGNSPSAIPPPAMYGSWPQQQTFYPPPPGAAADYFYPQGPTSSGPSYLPAPGALYPPPPAMRPRASSSSSYASRSSHRYEESPDAFDARRRDSPLDDSDDERRHHHHHHRRHHGSRHGSYSHGDRGDSKYSGHSDHASLADTLVLIWDGLSGGLGKPKRH